MTHTHTHTHTQQMPIEYVEKMFDIHTKYNEMIVKCFDGNAKFTGALDKVIVICYKYVSRSR